MKYLPILLALAALPAHAEWRESHVGTDDVVAGAAYVPSKGIELPYLDIKEADGGEIHAVCEITFLSPDLNGRIRLENFVTEQVATTTAGCEAALRDLGRKINANPKGRIAVDYDDETSLKVSAR